MAFEPYSQSNEEILLERSLDQWVGVCDRWAWIAIDLASASEPPRESVGELMRLGAEVAFRAAGWRIVATPLREFLDALAGYSSGLDPWDARVLTQYLRGANIIVSEVRDRAFAGALERSGGAHSGAEDDSATGSEPRDRILEPQANQPEASVHISETHCGGDSRFPTTNWILLQRAVEELHVPTTTLQRWVNALPTVDRGETEPIKRTVIRRSALPGLRARRDSRNLQG
jgi:hypothetical protein